MTTVPLERRTLPDSLRYLADYLSSGGHWVPVALTLRTLAAELDAQEGTRDAT